MSIALKRLALHDRGMTPDVVIRGVVSLIASGFVHIVGLTLFIVSWSPQCMDCGIFWHERGTIDVYEPKPPLLIYAPAPLNGARWQLVSPEDDRRCAPLRPAVTPARLISAPIVEAGQDGRRDPRLCLRLGADGRVLSVKTLLSSGDNRLDKEAEMTALGLLFAPAHRNGVPIASTATYDVIGAQRRQMYDPNSTGRRANRK